MTSQLLRTRPERLRSVGILAGFVAAVPQPADAKLLETRPAVFWGRGDSDAVVSAEAVVRARDFLATHTMLDENVYAGLGHSIDERVLTDLRDYLLR